MQCVTPMFRQYERGNHKKGRVVSRQEVYEELHAEPNKIKWYLDEFNKMSPYHKYEMIPCGHCWACKLNYSAQWATRIMYECSQHEHNYFITITYNDLFLPIPEESEYNGKTYTNDGTWSGTLCPEDITRFINTLRQDFLRDKNHTGIKYYYCGEYGTNDIYLKNGKLKKGTQRPHYHMILMNCPLDLNQFYDFHIDENKKLHWKSKEIDHYWSEHKMVNGKETDISKGLVDIAEVEFASAAYVARYCMKKLTDETDKTIYWSKGKIPEYVRMSRRPGIGMNYFNEHMHEIYKTDSLLVKNFHGKTLTVKPPKTWDKRFKELFPEQWKPIEKSRKACSERSRKLLETMTDLSDRDKLLQNAEEVLRKGNQLPRIGEW